MTRVLVVDDEPRIVSFVARALTAEGFRVDGAQDADSVDRYDFVPGAKVLLRLFDDTEFLVITTINANLGS